MMLFINTLIAVVYKPELVHFCVVYLFIFYESFIFIHVPSCRKLTYSIWFDSIIRSVLIFFNPLFWCCLVDEVWWFLKIRHKHDKRCNSSLFFGFTMISVTCLVFIPCSSFKVCFLWLLFFFTIITASNRYSFYYHTLRKAPKDYNRHMGVLRMATFNSIVFIFPAMPCILY